MDKLSLVSLVTTLGLSGGTSAVVLHEINGYALHEKVHYRTATWSLTAKPVDCTKGFALLTPKICAE